MFYIMHSKRNLRKKNSRRRNRLGGRHPDADKKDNKGKPIYPRNAMQRQQQQQRATPPPPASPPVLRRQNAIVHDLSLQPDAPSQTGSDMSLSSISSASSSYSAPTARRLFSDNEGLFSDNEGEGVKRKKNRKSRKNRKIRKSRKSKKNRKSRKNRKQKKTTKRLRR